METNPQGAAATAEPTKSIDLTEVDVAVLNTALGLFSAVVLQDKQMFAEGAQIALTLRATNNVTPLQMLALTEKLGNLLPEDK